ncbi:hypothetical protein [Micromonospora deserti]|uniref:Uncharacterized protein n=1 Tax=Micromonospora deserti TaxID=2070366 RepID=A0A2W2CRM2_9ACTN|nr:hypothetical protein [Micromonospora deserti]PZG02222.1 hypothetical protein C1I99_03725 [Micromonospora deserti]
MARWQELGATAAALVALARLGVLVRVAPEVFLAPTAVEESVSVVRALPQPFSVSQARQRSARFDGSRFR